MNKEIYASDYSALFDRLKRKYGPRPAIKEDETEVTYDELFSRADSMAAYFLRSGIERGSSVMIQLDNSILFAVAAFAAVRIGAVPVLVYPACRENELLSIAESARPAAFISFRKSRGYDHSEAASRIAGEVSSVKIIEFSDKLEALELSEYILNEDEIYYASDSEIAVIVLSGGSTGVPKLIGRKHAEHIMAAKLCAESCGLDEESVFLLAMPAAHNFNLVGPGLIGTLIAGGKVVMCKNSVPSEIVSIMKKEKVTATALVPSLASECIQYAEKNGPEDAFASLKTVQLGGAVCSRDIVKRVHDKMGCMPQQIYGMGEGIIFATKPDDPMEIIEEYQGADLTEDYDTIRIIDENGADVPEGEYGELIAKGPCIITSYYNAPESDENKFTSDGFYRTGDRVRLYKGKYIHVAGRIDDMINKSGEKIYPAELEACINKCEGVEDSAVIGIENSSYGNIVCAFILENSGLSADNIKRSLEAMKIATYKMPDEYIFIREWPRTSVKKKDKKALRQIAEKALFDKAHTKILISAEGMDETERLIAHKWADILKTADINMDSNFLELGGNSLQAGMMIGDINKCFGTDISIEDLYCSPELCGFAGIVRERSEKQV